MALYSYVKKKFSLKKSIARVFSIFCLSFGLGLLLWVLLPILIFEISYTPKYQGLIEPIPNTPNVPIADKIVSNLPKVLGAEHIDYTKASVWFPQALSLKLASSSTSYTLDIPKLGIEKALVLVGGEDLTKSLIHFTGSLPGKYGNPVIFGHSTIIWFYNPKDYKSIFSKLPDLNVDDNIFVSIDNVTYRYKVFETQVVSQNNLSVLEQNYDYAYITLVTCVPPGTYLKRLIVRGRLVNI